MLVIVTIDDVVITAVMDAQGNRCIPMAGTAW